MRALLTGIALGLGLVVILVAAGSGSDNTDKTVRAETWAKDVCQTVGTWEGALKVVREEVQKSNYGARNSDGAIGDFVEHTAELRVAVDRAYIATRQTLRRGIRQAGIPDAPQGVQASAALRVWAAQTETSLLAARHVLKQDPPNESIASNAYETLIVPATALAKSVAVGRATVKAVRASDPALDQAFSRSTACRRLERRTA